MLYLIGLGLYNEKDISLRGLENLEKSDKIFIDHYTHIISDNTIDKLEKWNGHLYNWYNIRNLSVLRPRYISSVDSGNFIGYLIVLKQSLNEYKNTPVIDDDIVQGLKETCEMEHTLTQDQLSFIDGFGSITGKTADEWISFLNMFVSIDEKSVSSAKRDTS